MPYEEACLGEAPRASGGNGFGSGGSCSPCSTKLNVAGLIEARRTGYYDMPALQREQKAARDKFAREAFYEREAARQAAVKVAQEIDLLPAPPSAAAVWWGGHKGLIGCGCWGGRDRDRLAEALEAA